MRAWVASWEVTVDTVGTSIGISLANQLASHQEEAKFREQVRLNRPGEDISLLFLCVNVVDSDPGIRALNKRGVRCALCEV